MFTFLAINHGEPRELASRRDQYTGSSFTHDITSDHRTGTVTLQPEGRVLRVGSSSGDYESVRIFTESGTLIAVMRRSPVGLVTWTQPMRI